MAASQNGWSVIDASETRKWVIPGADRHMILRDGHAGFVLAWFALWFHEVIERLSGGVWDEWGFAARNVRGSSSTISNHASGTAEDLNATRHPLGRRGTFTKAWHYTKIRALLSVRLVGVIRWGADYQFRADEMHFEINKGAAAVLRLARRLSATPRGKRVLRANPGYQPPVLHKPGSRSLSVGDSGPDVRFVQKKVGVRVDGQFGPKTQDAVRDFERSMRSKYPRIDADGEVGRITWRAFGVTPTY
jgi:hypothetical protein